MPKEWLAKQLEQASNEVKSWPEWKRVELQLDTKGSNDRGSVEAGRKEGVPEAGEDENKP